MSCVSGVAAAAGSMYPSFGQVDPGGLLSGLVLTGRGNKVSQDFSRRLAAIDYKIQRQQLHREDIRDLVDLTTARMDIYNLVGTLLLTFCITWYTDNPVMAGQLPAWYMDLFLISNFSSVGYLVLSVWLAMYAAVASRAIGTRLLTSFNRLALPSKDDLNKVKIPIYFPLDNFLDVGRRLLGRSDGAVASTDGAASPRRIVSESKRGTWWSTKTGRTPKTEENKEFRVDNEDDEQHLRRFLLELPRYLSHDKYSRVCMSFGMNDMLQTLSYHILGCVWAESPISASICFAAVKMLSVIIMRLDFVNTTEQIWRKNVMIMFFLHFMPPVLAAVNLWCPVLVGFRLVSDRHFANYCFVSSFFLHAGWFGYVATQLRAAGLKGGGFRPSEFANVLDWVDCKAVRKDLLEAVDRAGQMLRQEVESVMLDEIGSGSVSAAARQSDRLGRLCRNLTEACSQLANDHSHPDAERELMHAEQTLNRYAVWARAPEVLAALEALRNPEVRGRLNEDATRKVEVAYTNFLMQCHELSLGIVADSDENQKRIAMRVAEGEERAVRMDTHWNMTHLPECVWVDTKTSKVLSEEPKERDGKVTSYADAIQKDVAQWRSDADMLTTDAKKSWREGSAAASSRLAARRDGAEHTINGGPTPGQWTGPTVAELEAPPEELPYRMVWWFTFGTMLLWILAGGSRAIFVLVHLDSPIKAPTRHLDVPAPSSIKWPDPASLFKVSALHCNDSHVWISSRFTAYVAQQSHNRSLGLLSELGHGAVGAVVCDARGCDALHPPARVGRPWLLGDLEVHRPEFTAVPLPPEWRLVSGAWKDVPGSAGRLTAWLVGWDGKDLVTATMEREAESGAWTVKPRFEVDPAVGLCTGGHAECGNRNSSRYDDVRALQLSAGGRNLMVLLAGGIVDAWDLSRGRVLWRGRLGDDYTSMCHGGGGLFLARQTNTGPVLATLQLPAVLALAVNPQQDSSEHEGGQELTPSRPEAIHARMKRLQEKRQVLLGEFEEIQAALVKREGSTAAANAEALADRHRGSVGGEGHSSH